MNVNADGFKTGFTADGGYGLVGSAIQNNWRLIVVVNGLKGDAGDDTVLIYLLAHKSPEAAKKSFDAFRQDPDWIAARKASEDKAGGSLTEAKGGVVSEFLKPTAYSPLK